MPEFLIPELRTRLHEVYDAGLEAGDVIHVKSEAENKHEGGVDFEIRVAKSLAKKPAPKEEADEDAGDKDDKPKEKDDPFMPPLNPHSLVCEYTDEEEGEGFRILLNKFAIVPRHFLLCTKEFVPQESPLTPAELYASFRILQQFEVADGDKKADPHACFFNCGEYSGASQPHKHIQFLSLVNGQVPFEPCIQDARPHNLQPGNTWSLPERLMPPFHVYADVFPAASLEPEQARDYLTQAYMSLIDATVDNMRRLSAQSSIPKDEKVDETGEIPVALSHLCYNVCMTTKWIMLVPRSQSEYVFNKGGQQDADKLSLNALGFAGMIMVKYDEQLAYVAEHGCRHVLRECGYPRAKPGNEAGVEGED